MSFGCYPYFIKQENDVLKIVEEYFKSKLLEKGNEETIIIQNETTLAKDELSWSNDIGIMLLLITVALIAIFIAAI